MTRFRRVIIGLTLALAGGDARGQAVVLSGIAGDSADAPADAPMSDSTPTRAPVPAHEADIVVTARYGEALVKPETELDEQAIDAYGAGSIGELVEQITPLIAGTAAPPVLLVNGQRVESIAGLNGFPPEALQRLAILPPEAAARYGYGANQRVVNLVLKKQFAAWQGEAALVLPTAGGRDSERLGAGRFTVDGRARWNARLQLTRDSRLLKSARVADTDAEITAGNPGDRRTLLPQSRTLSATLGLVRPLGGFTGSLTLDANRRTSQQWLGPGPDDGSGPDEGAAALDPLRGDQSSNNLNLSMMLAGPVAGWQGSLTGRYARGWSRNLLERIATAAADGPPTDPDPARRVRDHGRNRNDSLSLQLNASRTLLTLPAGPLTSNLAIGGTGVWSLNRRRDDDAGDWTRNSFGRRQLDTQLSLAIPLLGPDAASGDDEAAASGLLPALGVVSLDLAGSASAATRTPLQSRLDVGVNWAPGAGLQLRAAAGFAQLTPSVDQLNGPHVEEVRRLYDYRRQEIAEPVWISGGNPDLKSGSQRFYLLRATWRPFRSPLLTLTSGYQRQVATDAVGAFPTLTPAVEAAFPERVVRDAEGRLLAVDARPISIARDLDERLDTSLNVALTPSPGGGTAGAARAWRATITVSHGWLLRSELLTHPGLPPIDRLHGDTAQSRHTVSAQIVIGRPGAGVTLDGIWQSPFRLRDATVTDGSADYHHRAVTVLNLRLFCEPERLIGGAGTPAWLSDLHLSLDIRNLFDRYRRVTLGDGTVPAGYARYQVDPLGRTVQIGLRKRF